MQSKKFRPLRRVLAALMALLMFPVAPIMAAPGDTVTSPRIAPGFLFEPEAVFGSLKGVAQWNELEQMLDNPYLLMLAPGVRGNDQGYPSYFSTVQRRRSFIFVNGVEQPLPSLLVHPLNYNPTTGEEMRLINPAYPGGSFDVPGQLVLVDEGPPAHYEWQYTTVEISPGADRVDGAAIDYNSPMGAQVPVTIIGTELNPPEGSLITGADPGEPGYAGFGVVNPLGYSLPALQVDPLDGQLRLFDPERGFIYPRNPVTQVGGLRKPTIGRPAVGQNYPVMNTDPDNVTPSNENDYVRNRDAAVALGKALFWDMQVGSDGIQSCGTCHFTAGVDDRTKNQLNPNHLGGDVTFQLHQPNEEVTAADFPFHKLSDPTTPGEPLLNPANVISDVNDVMSSMGVVFHEFVDILTPGTGAFGAAFDGVAALLPDIGDAVADPIPGFQGLRRVEPRNTPTMFAAAFNFDNFWDGRARHDFNGGSVFGAADPQSHVWMNDGTAAGELTATRQIIRFSSIASLATGPALSNFEMSFNNRNWSKIGKKLLQSGVTPLANQLVDPTDSVLGPYSGQRSVVGGPVDRPGRPGLNVSYRDLIQIAYYPQLWANTSQHLDGASVSTVLQPDQGGDPFDGFALTLAAGPSVPANTSQFNQMEANMPLFFGLSVQLWVEILVPDDTPFDQMCDQNPDAGLALGEAGEPGLVADLPTRGQGIPGPSFQEVGNFKRDPGLTGHLADGTAFIATGTRQPGSPDPLLGMDLFMGSNLSLKNPNFRSARCGSCHLAETFTDHSMDFSHALSLGDFVPEFSVPGAELPLEPLGRPRTISGFLLESELAENAQDAIERFVVNQSLIPNPVDGLAYPDGASFLDNGIYNLGIRPIAEDIGRGGDDPFGLPLSLSALMLKNLGGVDYVPGTPLPTFDPDLGQEGGLFEESPQDQLINPGFEAEPLDPMLPPHVAPWANQVPVGNTHPQMDEVAVGLNQLTEDPILEGFIDALGPFNPAGTLNEAFNNTSGTLQGLWPAVNRVGRNGSFKAPQLRNVELTGPYFHTGGKLTLRQELDFYMRGGDFPITNGGGVPYDVVNAHRDMNIIDLRNEIQSSVTEEEAQALIDFLLELTDERVRFEKAPFDHPEVIVPVDGAAPDIAVAGGRAGLLASPVFRQIPAVGAQGRSTPLPNFMGVSRTRVPGPNNDHFDGQNLAPTVGAAAFAFTATATIPLTISAPGLLAGAADPNGDPLTVELVSGPTNPNATLVLNPNGSFTYTYGVNTANTIVDSFTIRVTDSQMTSNIATVTITVNPRQNGPIAVDDFVTTRRNASVAISVVRNDLRVNRNTVQLVDLPDHGTATLLRNGIVRYRPDRGFVGVDTFTYTVRGGGLTSNIATVTVTVRR